MVGSARTAHWLIAHPLTRMTSSFGGRKADEDQELTQVLLGRSILFVGDVT